MQWILPLIAACAAQSSSPDVMIVARGFGFSHIDPATGVVIKTVSTPLPSLDTYGMTFDGSRLVAIDRGPLGLPLDQIVDIHPSDGDLSVYGLTGYAWNIGAIEIDPVSGICYALHVGDLYTIDLTTGAATLVGPLQGLKPFDCVCGLAIDAQGRAFGVGLLGGALYSLDLPSATATHLGDLPFWSGIITDAAIDSSGRLFTTWQGGPPLPSGVYEIDVASLSVTLVVPDILGTGLAFVPATAETPYCTPKTNALGCDPVLSSLGLASPTASSGYEVTATNVANQTNGRLIYSLVGGASNPFAGGTWCVAAPWTGSPIVSSGGTSKPALDCSGSWAADVNTLLSQKPGPQPGDTIYCQWIGRDRGFAAPDNYALTSALEFTLLP